MTPNEPLILPSGGQIWPNGKRPVEVSPQEKDMLLRETLAEERNPVPTGVVPGPGPLARAADPAPLHVKPHGHYFKPVPTGTVDVYRVLLAFNVSDPCIAHAVKKLLVAGGRGAGKDAHKDIQEAIDSLTRWQEMRAEEGAHEHR